MHILGRLLIGILLLYSNKSLYAQAVTEVELKDLLGISLPHSFVSLSGSEIEERYPQTRPPLAVYEDPQRQSSWTFTSNTSIWPPEDINLLEAFTRAKIEELYESKVEWIDKQIYDIQEQKVLLLSFIGKLSSSTALSLDRRQSYHSLISFIRNGEQVVLHFRCPVSGHKEQVDEVRYSVESLRLY